MVEAVISGAKNKNPSILLIALFPFPFLPTGLHSDQWPYRGGTERDVAEENQTPKNPRSTNNIK